MLRILGTLNPFSGHVGQSVARKRRQLRLSPIVERLEHRELLTIGYQSSDILVGFYPYQYYNSSITQYSPNISSITDSSSFSGILAPVTGTLGSYNYNVSVASVVSGANAGTESGSVSISTLLGSTESGYANPKGIVSYNIEVTPTVASTLLINCQSDTSIPQGSQYTDSASCLLSGYAEITAQNGQMLSQTDDILANADSEYTIAVHINIGDGLPDIASFPSGGASATSSFSWQLTPVPPDIAMNSAAISSNGKNVTASYSISGNDLTSPGTIDYYWATGSDISDEIGSTPATQVSTNTAVGTYTASTSIASLGTQPVSATYILAVADSPSADPNNSFVSVASPTILPDLSMNSAAISSNGEGVNAVYTISGKKLATAGTIDFYWATGPNISNEIGTEPAKKVTTNTAVGTYTASTSIASLGAEPVNATYILAVADSPSADPNHNVTSVSSLLIDLSPLELQAAGGFALDTQTNRYTALGTILIGLVPAVGQPFQPFLQLQGSASYDAATIQFEGTVFADIGSVTAELFEGSWTINVGQSSTNSIQLTSGSQSLILGGLPVSVSSLALTQQGIALQGSISLPTSASGNAGPLSFAANGPLTMSVDGNNSILISQAGISISGGQLQLPDTALTYSNISFVTTGLMAQYEAPATPQQSDSFTIQGTATLSSPFGTLQANFTAPNYIIITNGQASFVGTITISNVPLPGGWALNNAYVNLDTVQGTLATGGSLYVPVGSGFNLNATFTFLQGDLNSVEVGEVFMNGGQELGITPLFLQSVSGEVDNLADDGLQPLTIEGSVVLTEGPVISISLPSWLGGPISGSIIELDVDGNLTADEVTGQDTLTIAGGLLANGAGSLDLNLTTGALTEAGSLTLLNGLVSTDGMLNVDGLGNIALSTNASVTLPGFSLLGYNYPPTQLASGSVSLQYIPSSPLTDDFVIATGTDNVFGSGTYGLKVDFAGDVTQFDPTVTTSTLQSILATNSAPTFDVLDNTDLQTVISAVNGLSTPVGSASITVNLNGGPFDDVLVSPPAGVTVVLTGNGSTTTIVGSSPALTESSGSVIVTGVTFTTASSTPTVLVTGGTLTLVNDIVQQTSGGTVAAISLTGGTLDLGTAVSPGDNTLNINGASEFLQETNFSPVPDIGNVLEFNGTPLAAPYLSLAFLDSSAVSSAYGQQVTFTASIQAANPADGSPGGDVDFVDTSTGTNLGSTQVTNGVATLTASALTVGSHSIMAVYGGYGSFSSSYNAVSLTVSPANVTGQVSINKSGLVYNRSTQLFGGTITITNTGTTNLIGILEFEVTGLPAGVTLANATGIAPDGNPYITVNLPNGVLTPGQSITFTVLFSDPTKVSFVYGFLIFDVNSNYWW
jgi:hypothetical protein